MPASKSSKYLGSFSGLAGDVVEVSYRDEKWTTTLSWSDEGRLRIRHKEFDAWLYLDELAKHEGWLVAHSMSDLLIRDGWVGFEEAVKFPEGSHVLIRHLDRRLMDSHGLELDSYFRSDWLLSGTLGDHPMRFLLVACPHGT
jgi:hypothetical protein